MDEEISNKNMKLVPFLDNSCFMSIEKDIWQMKKLNVGVIIKSLIIVISISLLPSL